MQSSDKNHIIDIAHLDEMTFGDRDLKLEILGLFREQTQMWQRILDPNTTTPDWMVGAHTIKGSARSIGAWTLGDICDGAEEAAKNTQMSRDEKYIWREQILRAIDEVLGEISVIEHAIAIDGLGSKPNF